MKRNVLTFLIQNGADVNAMCYENNGAVTSPLLLCDAVFSDDGAHPPTLEDELVTRQTLLEAGTDPTVYDNLCEPNSFLQNMVLYNVYASVLDVPT